VFSITFSTTFAHTPHGNFAVPLRVLSNRIPVLVGHVVTALRDV
jgi:hypothetical protein